MDFLSDYLDFTQVASHTLLWIVLLPLFGAFANGVWGGRASKSLVTSVAVGSVFTSFLLALYAFGTLLRASHGEGDDDGRIVQTVYHWFSISIPAGDGAVFDIPIQVRFVMDHLSAIMTVMVTGIASLIHVYSTSYMGDDPGYPRFMTYLNLFTASMLILVLGSNIPLMFVGWEGVGLCSYLLIGYWWENPAYAAAGRKAFVVNRIGDFGVLLGTFILVSIAHSFEFDQINAAAAEIAATPFMLGGAPLGILAGTLAALLLFLGCTGKSAQLPLYVWLPDAMAGPTPVSALIHAATMVTAGVYLTCRLSPIFIHSPTAMSVIALVGAATAFVAASIGLVQNQMKKILAYSTVSQLGFMFAAVGCGAFSAGIFHVFTHAFFKACLFLGAGSVMHAVHAHGDADIRYLGGMRKFMPRTHATFAIACAAIAGVPLLSGFFSKDEILLGALESTAVGGLPEQYQMAPWVGYTVFTLLAVTAAMTAFYMFRLYFRTFWGEFKGGHPPAEGHEGDHHDDEHAHHEEPHESDDAITIPLTILAIGAVLVGYLGLPHWLVGEEWSWWGHWMNGTPEHWGPVSSWAVLAAGEATEHEGMGFGPLAMGIGTLVGLGGIGLAWAWYYRADGEVPAGLMQQWPRLHSFLMDKWRVDEFYEAVLLGPFKWIAVVAANIDRILVDGLLTVVPGWIARGMGFLATRAQTGAMYAYTTMFAIGSMGVVWWFTYPHTTIVGQPNELSVSWSAERGTGYVYRWDFDSDDVYDTEWSDSPVGSHTYGSDDAIIELRALVEGGPSPEEALHEVSLRSHAAELPLGGFDIAEVAPAEGQEAPTPVAPTVRLVESEGVPHVILDSGTAQVTFGTEHSDADRHEFQLELGDVALIGGARVRIAAYYCATVEVRSAFGNLSHEQACEVIRVPHTELRELALGGAR